MTQVIWSLVLSAAGLLAGLAAMWQGAGANRWWRSMSSLASSRPGTPRVTVVIPARDERASLPALLRSLANQRDALGRPLDPLVLVIDDDSRDGTAVVARELGATVIMRHEPPTGGGNPKAKALAEAESLIDGGVVVFADADVVFSSPEALMVLAEAALSAPQDLFSVQPLHRCQGIVESLAILPNVIALMASGALAAGNASFASRVAFGPVMAMDAARYRSVGGPRAVADAIGEDAALARLVRAAGGVSHVIPGSDWVWFRMYPHGLAQQFEGFTKNLALGARAATGWPVVSAVVWVLGLFATLGGALGPLTGAIPPLLAWTPLLVYIFELVALSRIAGRYSWWIYPLVPFAALFFLAVSATSLFRTLVLRKVRWKGRSIEIGGHP